MILTLKSPTEPSFAWALWELAPTTQGWLTFSASWPAITAETMILCFWWEWPKVSSTWVRVCYRSNLTTVKDFCWTKLVCQDWWSSWCLSLTSIPLSLESTTTSSTSLPWPCILNPCLWYFCFYLVKRQTRAHASEYQSWTGSWCCGTGRQA